MENYCTHCFSVELATKVGMREAVILQHFYWWHQHNSAVKSMNIDGRVWFYLSSSKIQEVFPYLSSQAVKTILSHLIENGFLIKDHKGEGQDKFDRTTWYSLTDKAIQLFHLRISTNGEAENNHIVNNRSYNTSSNEESNIVNIGKRFIKPSIEEIRAYCLERGNSVDAEIFHDFYESKGWRIGNNPMKDWRAAVRTWERSRNIRSQAPATRKATSDALDYDFSKDY